VVVACVWTVLLWRFAHHAGVRQLTLLVGANLVLNLAFFATHPVFTPYYIIPILMLSLWTLMFAAVFTPRPGKGRPRGRWTTAARDVIPPPTLTRFLDANRGPLRSKTLC